MLLMVIPINECIKRLYGANRALQGQRDKLSPCCQPQPFVCGQAKMGFTVHQIDDTLYEGAFLFKEELPRFRAPLNRFAKHHFDFWLE